MKTMFYRTFILLIFLLFSTGLAYASFTNFDFSLKEYLVSENTETEVYFSYLFSGYENKDFVVKPLIGNGTVEIFNPEKREWVGSFSFTEYLPKISENMLIRFQNLNVNKTYLWFEIESLKDGKTYFTPKKSIWGEKIYDGYVEEINYSVSNYEDTTKEGNNEVFEVMETSQSYKSSYLGFIENIPKKLYLYFSIGLFLAAAIFGFLSQKPKNKKEMIQSISEDFKKLDTCNICNASHLRSLLD
ncbi:MAG: hypothetical protein ABIJ82_03670 [Patescibacteria group bacterium]